MARFYTADLHFSHRNIVAEKFGAGSRPFDDIEQMNECIIESWNNVVSEKDTTYVLGDVAFAITQLDSLRHCHRLNGRKFLVMGNHDYDAEKYIPYFDKVMAYKDMTIGGEKLLLSHIPVHPGQLEKRWKINIHGHLHSYCIQDLRYMCVSLEQNNYMPFHESQVLERLRELEDAQEV